MADAEVLGVTEPDHRFKMKRGSRPDLGGVISQVARRRPVPPRPPFWWIPGRSPDPVGSQKHVAKFRAKLAEISPLLAVAWDWDMQRWAIWCRNPRVKTPWCKGWWRLFTVESNHEYWPLDEVVLATIFERDMSLRGNLTALQYHDRCLAEVERERQVKKADVRDEDMQMAADMYDYHQIKNIGRGNKHLRYHSGS